MRSMPYWISTCLSLVVTMTRLPGPSRLFPPNKYSSWLNFDTSSKTTKTFFEASRCLQKCRYSFDTNLYTDDLRNHHEYPLL
ncbi:hypothetical protein V6Z11_A11G326000 [Gossypium hirsutum]